MSSPWVLSRRKRIVDLVVATAAAVALSPLIAATAVAVRLRLGPPVLFRQTRAGRNGTPIEVPKFRTMSDTRGPDGELLADRDRLAPFGRLLRSTSLDELPQLINVIRGEMSLVGPRPLPLRYVPLYSDEQRRRLDARPGLTGWAQVNGRNTTDWPTRLAHDVHYVDHASWHLDARIIVATIRIVIARSGISADHHATMPPFTG